MSTEKVEAFNSPERLLRLWLEFTGEDLAPRPLKQEARDK